MTNTEEVGALIVGVVIVIGLLLQTESGRVLLAWILIAAFVIFGFAAAFTLPEPS